MNNLGAIPKAKGGARPKIKIVANEQISDNCQRYSSSYHKTKLLGSTEESITDAYNPEVNKYKRNSYSDVPDNGNQIASFQDARSSGNPLEIREIHITDEGAQIKRPALSVVWVEKRIFIHYIRPPLPDADSFSEGATDAWIEQMEFLVDDLYWLLSLPHYRFWSQMIHDRSVQECLEAYLGGGFRWYDTPTLPQGPDSCVLHVINEIHLAVFLVYLRLSTYKESKDNFITPAVFADLIYDNFLYDICKCLDLCVLYGATNLPLLEKMMDNIFDVQPKYYEDLALLVDTLKNVLDSLEQKLSIYDPTLPRSVRPEDISLTVDELQDIIRYVQDTFCSLHAFLSIFPKACQTFHHKEFAPRLSLFYGKAVPKLVELIISCEMGDVGDEERLLRRRLHHELATARMNALAVFRDILAWNCLRREASPEMPSVCGLDAISKGIESFTHILTSCLEDKVFIVDYNSAFGFEQDIAYFQEVEADMTPLNFVKEAVESIVSEMNLPPERTADSEVATASLHQSTVTGDDTSGMSGYYVGETSALSDVEVTSLVSSIQDLLPHLGDGFVKECLKYYNYVSEETLNALLEDKLPPALNTLDRSLKDKEPGQQDDSPSPVGTSNEAVSEEARQSLEGPLCNRLNVYDDDEFDMFRRPTKFDKSRVHKGKNRSRDAPVGGLEKDPQLAEKMKLILHEYEASSGYSIYEDEEKYSPLTATVVASSANYDDEYDDTYDDDDAGDIDGGFLDQDKRRRAAAGFISLRGRGALNTPGMSFVEGEDEEAEDEGEKNEPIMGDVKERGPPHVAKFKRANASNRRQVPSYEGDRDPRGCVPSLVFINSGRGRSRRGSCGEREDVEPVGEPRSAAFEPFCENPQETRRRFERKKMAQQFRNKGFHQQPCSPGTQEELSRSSWEPPPRFATKATKHSGKSWRQEAQGEDSDRRQYGGKYKENTNHGKAQDRNYRYKMMHKNEQRRNAAQAKYRNNF